jgi:hypothetical protein
MCILLILPLFDYWIDRQWITTGKYERKTFADKTRLLFVLFSRWIWRMYIWKHLSHSTVNLSIQFNQIISDKKSPLGQNAAREFFLWAIFLDRFELAKYLCSKTWVIFSFNIHFSYITVLNIYFYIRIKLRLLWLPHEYIDTRLQLHFIRRQNNIMRIMPGQFKHIMTI